MSEEIKACPFCGSDANYHEQIRTDGQCHYTVGFVCCNRIGCLCGTVDMIVDGHYGITTTKEDVIKIWNRRVQK